MPRGLGSGEEQVTTGEATHMPWSISSDGVLFYQEEGPDDGNGGVLTLFTNGDRKPQPLLDESDDASTPQISPDRRWLAYTSNRTRRGEVHIRAYPKSSRVWPVSPGGDPVWSRSGDELFFLDDGKMKSVKMTPGADPPFTTPSVVFDVAQNYGSS
jgi:hypothetical protein